MHEPIRSMPSQWPRANSHLHWLLVQAAQYILGPLAPDSGLRRWGLELAARGGKNAKKRALVAVARKLAVLLHRLWVTAEAYEPLHGIESQAALAADLNFEEEDIELKPRWVTAEI